MAPGRAVLADVGRGTDDVLLATAVALACDVVLVTGVALATDEVVLVYHVVLVIGVVRVIGVALVIDVVVLVCVDAMADYVARVADDVALVTWDAHAGLDGPDLGGPVHGRGPGSTMTSEGFVGHALSLEGPSATLKSAGARLARR
eukprot:1458057-Pyramimonas_sp.AAC.1